MRLRLFYLERSCERDQAGLRANTGKQASSPKTSPPRNVSIEDQKGSFVTIIKTMLSAPKVRKRTETGSKLL